MLWKVVKLFLDKKTADKVATMGSDVRTELLQYYEESSLWTFFGGSLNFQPQFKAMYTLEGAPLGTTA